MIVVMIHRSGPEDESSLLSWCVKVTFPLLKGTKYEGTHSGKDICRTEYANEKRLQPEQHGAGADVVTKAERGMDAWMDKGVEFCLHALVL